MRTEYPTLVRERIWSSASELYQNAARNTIEFASEGFDWRNVAEDEQFVQCPSGERIHPIHYSCISKSISNAVCHNSSCEQKDCHDECSSAPVSMDTEPLAS